MGVKNPHGDDFDAKCMSRSRMKNGRTAKQRRAVIYKRALGVGLSLSLSSARPSEKLTFLSRRGWNKNIPSVRLPRAQEGNGGSCNETRGIIVFHDLSATGEVG